MLRVVKSKKVKEAKRMMLLVDMLHKSDSRLLRIEEQKKMTKLVIIKAKEQVKTLLTSYYRSHG